MSVNRNVTKDDVLVVIEELASDLRQKDWFTNVHGTIHNFLLDLDMTIHNRNREEPESRQDGGKMAGFHS